MSNKNKNIYKIESGKREIFTKKKNKKIEKGNLINE
jgi:hypothetical protein